MLKHKSDILRDKVVRNKENMIFCTLSAFLWGLAAHAYMFFSNSFSHDSLNEFDAEIYGNSLRLAYGRIFVPAYRVFSRGDIALPWLIGLLSLLYIAGAVFLVVKIFDIRSKSVCFLTAGIFAVNVTVTATAATYIHDLDCDMLAMFFAVVAVYLWKTYKYGFLPGAVFVMLSLGLYQSYISVTIVLVLFYLIWGLFNSVKFKETILTGLKSTAMLLIGGLIYAAAIKITLLMTNINAATGDNTSLDKLTQFSLKDALILIERKTRTFIGSLVNTKTVLPYWLFLSVSLIFVVTALVFFCRALAKKTAGVKESLLALVLAVLIPTGMNISYILTNGIMHDVMRFSYWLAYFIALMLSTLTFAGDKKKTKKLRRLRITAVICLSVILWGNVRSANMLYLAKDFEHDATLSYLTTVVARMEETEGYKPGKTPVVFVGVPEQSLMNDPAFDPVRCFTGAHTSYALGVAGRDYYKAYFTYVLMNPALIANKTDWVMMRHYSYKTQTMPCWPDKDSVKIINGIMVVKLGENK